MFTFVLIGLVFIFSYGIGNVTAVSGDTIYVNGSSGQDNWDGQIAVWNGTSGPKASIKNATGTVNNGGIINIADGVYSGAQNTNIVIYKNMNIKGQSQDSTIINGTNMDDMNGIFTILPGYNVTITDLTMCNGYTVRGGAAITCEGNLTVNNCNFEYNQASIGGAICTWWGSFLTINNCNFTSNNATIGGAISNDGTLNVNNSTFINNTATNNGGAINNIDTLIVTNSTFTGNSASFGGAISNNGSLSVNNDTFINNTAINNGGAINNIDTLNVTNSTFTGNSASFGGAIDNIGVQNSIMTINNSTFTNNNALNGAAILNGFGNSIIQYNRIVGNTATIGNSIYSLGGTVNATLNWWGSNSGPSTKDIYGNIITTPWLVITANASPNSGLYNTTQNITLTMSEPGTIYYTTNGTDPTITSPVYTTPLSISSTTTLKYIASNLAGNLSPIYTQTYTIDTINPTASANTTGGFYNNTQNITLSMSEPGTIYYTTNGTDPTTSSSVYSTTVSISTNTTLKYLAVDLAGNKSPVYSQTYTIDKIAPTATASIVGGLYNSTKVVTLSMNKNGTIYYTLNGSIPTTTSTKYTGPITIGSTTTLKFLASDLAGNKSPIYTQIYTIDKVAPKVSSTSPTNNNIRVSLTAPITIKFSKNIVAGANYSKIYIKNITTGQIVGITQSISGNTLTIKMAKSRLHGNTYQVYIPTAAVKDKIGNNLVATYTFKFKTV